MTSSSVPPPLRPYMITIGSAKRKRNVSQKIMDRWTTGTTSTSAITDGLLSHPTPLHHTNVANNQRTSRNSICLSPMKLPNCSDNMGRNKCDPFSSTSLTPTTTTTTTSHAMLLYSMLYNGGSDRSYRSHDGKAHPDIIILFNDTLSISRVKQSNECGEEYKKDLRSTNEVVGGGRNKKKEICVTLI